VLRPIWELIRAHAPIARSAAVIPRPRCSSTPNAEQHLRGYAGILQAHAYADFNRLYEADRKGGHR
jgi:transposase